MLSHPSPLALPLAQTGEMTYECRFQVREEEEERCRVKVEGGKLSVSRTTKKVMGKRGRGRENRTAADWKCVRTWLASVFCKGGRCFGYRLLSFFSFWRSVPILGGEEEGHLCFPFLPLLFHRGYPSVASTKVIVRKGKCKNPDKGAPCFPRHPTYFSPDGRAPLFSDKLRGLEIREHCCIPKKGENTKRLKSPGGIFLCPCCISR